MKTFQWKSTGALSLGGWPAELHYRMEEGELCREYEDELVARARGGFGKYADLRTLVGNVWTMRVAHREIVFTVVPCGYLPILGCDFGEELLDSFLVRPIREDWEQVVN